MFSCCTNISRASTPLLNDIILDHEYEYPDLDDGDKIMIMEKICIQENEYVECFHDVYINGVLYVIPANIIAKKYMRNVKNKKHFSKYKKSPFQKI